MMRVCFWDCSIEERVNIATMAEGEGNGSLAIMALATKTQKRKKLPRLIIARNPLNLQ